jgi:NADH-quinone oxidoreductase subunit I
MESVFCGLYNLGVGMSISMKNFLRPKVTEQYPENRGKKVYPERFRALLVMPHNDKNQHKCTGCGICMMNCPNGTITVITRIVTDETGKTKKVLDRHRYNLGSCIFCALCTISCPQSAIAWSNEFEHSLFDRRKLELQLNRPGSELAPENKEE